MWWRWVLGGGLLVVALYFTLPGNVPMDLTYSAVGLGATVAVVAGVRLHHPPARSGWYLVAAANACFVVGDAVLNGYDLLDVPVPYPSMADVIYLAGYPLLFAGVFRIVRPRSLPGQTVRDSWTDAAIVSVGGLGLSWHFLMGPALHGVGRDGADAATGGLGQVVTMLYPVMDIGVLSVLASAVLWGAARRASDHLLVAAVAIMLVSDFVYDLQVQHGSYTVDGPVNAGYLLNYVLLAAAALHPGVKVEPAPVASAVQRRRWLPLVAGAALVSPAILLVSGVSNLPVDLPVLSATSLVVFALIAVRVSWLFSRVTRQNQLLQDRTESLRWALAAQRMLEVDLAHQALHDGLTGLANRGLLQDRIDQALSGPVPRPVALCFCDLDNFKAVNDSLGHQSGDELLVVVGKRLASIVRGVATVARLGGDEFAVLLEDDDQPESATALAERIVSVLRQPIRLDGQEITLTVSVGVAIATAGSSTQRLLSEADAAMYEAKAAGRDRVAVFETFMRSRLVEKMTVINHFPGALQRGEFFLEYQPQFSLADERLEGFECLVRWRHPTLGVIGPGRFVPLAEETRFIVPLGRWILVEACREAAGWAQLYGRALTLSVNLSGWQLEDAGLRRDIEQALSGSSLPAQDLVLEVTESVLLANPASTAQVLRDLKRLGIRIAIDDFGTGYSSLSHLRQLPVDILKIDKSFIDPLADPASEGDAFVATIVRLAQDLHLDTTAEGIECELQREALIRLGCQSGQGYLMSASLSAPATGAFIRAWRRHPPVPELTGRPAEPAALLN